MFKKAYIPRTLTEVKNYERDVDIMMKLKEEDMALNVQQDNVSRRAEALQERWREYKFFLLETDSNKKTPEALLPRCGVLNLVSYFKVISLVLILTCVFSFFSFFFFEILTFSGHKNLRLIF